MYKRQVGLTSIWFAAGSFVAFIIALLGGNVVVQGIAFILVSVVLLALTKPWADVYKRQLYASLVYGICRNSVLGLL